MPEPHLVDTESTHNRARNDDDHTLPGAGWYERIPTTNPDEALRFCRLLAQVLQAQSNVPTTPQNQEPPYNGTIPASGLHTPGSPPAVERPDISVVLPVYNEEDNIPALYERLTTTLQATVLDYELIFVNDGSRDNSVELLHHYAASDQRVTVIDLARNFGHQIALSAGLEYTRGRGVIVMDSDLQDPPEVLPQFIARWQEGYEVVYAIREHRKEIWIKRLAYAGFYRILQRVSHIDIPLDAGDFCIMDRRVVDILVRMPERKRFVRGIRSWVGFNQTGLAYERHARYGGRPKYTFSRLIELALDGIISFSYMPLRAISMMGIGVSLLSIFFAAYYTFMRLMYGLNPPGFPTLIVTVLFLSGVQLITLGVTGEYVGRIFEEVKQRPLYIVRRVIRQQQSAAPHTPENVHARVDA
jgi:dolichol-phosphate mannosyltransferase